MLSYQNIPKLLTLAGRKAVTVRFLALILNLDRNRLGLRISNALISSILQDNASKTEKLLKMVRSTLLDEFNAALLPNEINEFILNLTEKMISSEESFFYSLRKVVYTIRSSGENISKANVKAYIEKIANIAQEKDIIIGGSNLGSVSLYKELALLDIGIIEKFVFDFLAGNEFQQTILSNDKIRSLFKINQEDHSREVRLIDLFILIRKTNNGSQEQLFNQVTNLINFIHEKGINDLNVRQKIYHSILRSAIRKNCNSFISNLMNSKNSLYNFFIGEKSILEMSEFIFLNALTEGRTDMINFIWDNEALGTNREKDNMLIKVLGSSDFHIDGSYKSFNTLRWVFNHINTDKSHRQGVKAFRVAWTVSPLFSYALLHERIDILNFLRDSWFLVFEDKTRMLNLLIQYPLHRGNSDNMIKWYMNTFNTYSGNTPDVIILRLGILCKLEKSLSELNTRLNLNLNEDILSLLKLTDNNSRDVSKLIIDRIVVSDDVEMLNSLWNDAKKNNEQNTILNEDNYLDNLEEAISSSRLKILNWIVNHVSEIKVNHQNIIRSDDYDLIYQAIDFRSIDAFKLMLEYTYKIGGVEEQKKILKQNSYMIFREVVNSNNKQMTSQILTLAMDRVTLDQQLQAALETRTSFFVIELFKKNLKKERNKEGSNYVNLIDKFFNAVESFYSSGKDNEKYRAFLIKTVISHYSMYLATVDQGIATDVVWSCLITLPEYKNSIFKKHLDFMFEYINHIVPVLNDNGDYINIFKKFLKNSKTLSGNSSDIQRYILNIILDYCKDIQNTSSIELLEYVSKLPEYRAQKILIESTINSYRQDINNKIISESVSPSKRNLDSSNTDNSQSNKFLKTGDLICSKTSLRNKREISNCISWEEIDEFNEEKNAPRDFEKIKIDSEKFLTYLKNQPSEKRSRLIEIANKVGKEKIKGRFHSKINVLINNNRVMSHLNKVGKISGITMYGMIAKNVFGDFFNGDYEGVAINVGFIAGGQGFSKVAEAVSLKGEELILNGKVMLGKSLKAASPFLARGTSAFIAYDLINQIKEYKKGNKDAVIGIASDSIYIGVDAAEIGIEIAESFAILEGVSSITGPIGAGIGAVIFVGTDIYKAIKQVASIDEVIHLTWGEKLIEELRAFLGLKPELEIEELFKKKELNNKLVKQAIDYLKQHDNIQRYIFPTYESETFCRSVIYKEKCNSLPLPGVCFDSKGEDKEKFGDMFEIKEREICTNKLKEDLNNIVLLDEKRTNIKWDIAKPDNPSEGNLLCLPKGNYEQVPESGAYYCEKAIGIEYTKNRTGNYTLFSLGDGNDYIKGFKNHNNIFIIGNGDKNIFGSDKDDIFILQGSSIKGYIHGGSGINTLDLSKFTLGKDYLLISPNRMHTIGSSSYVSLSKVNRIVARKDEKDIIDCDFNIQYIDGNGGKSSIEQDIISIGYDECSSDYKHSKNCGSDNHINGMQIVVRPYTTIHNYVSKGKFKYFVNQEKGRASINLENSGKHSFLFQNTLQDITDINFNNTSPNRINIKFQFLKNIETFISYNSKVKDISYELDDDTKIHIGNKGNLYATQNTDRFVREIIAQYPHIANNLKISLFVYSSLNDESIAIGHGKHDVLHNDPHYKSHLIGNGGENIYVITSGYEKLDYSKLPIPEVVIYDIDKENLIDTLDLRQIKKQVKKDLDKNLMVRISTHDQDLLIQTYYSQTISSITVSSQKVTYFITKIRLKNALVTNWYERLHIIINNIPMKIEEFKLKPLPLVFAENDKNIIIIQPEDIEEESKIIVSEEIGNYTFARIKNNLIITNAFLPNSKLRTITLVKFYQEAKIQTLVIKFTDKEIVLKDHKEKISIARDFDKIKKEYEDKVYNSIFDHVKRGDVSIKTQSIHKHRHKRKHNRHRRNAYENSINNAPSNGLLSWLNRSIGKLFYSKFTFITELEKTSLSNMSQLIDINGTLTLLDLFIRKITGQKYIPLSEEQISQSEARSYALSITKKFKQILKNTAKESGISLKNINFFTICTDIESHIIGGRCSKILKTLYLSTEEAFPEFKQINKFSDMLKICIEKMLDEIMQNETKIVNSRQSENRIKNVISPQSSLKDIDTKLIKKIHCLI